MYLLVISYVNGDVDYIGPFKDEGDAMGFAQGIDTVRKANKLIAIARWFVKPLIPPRI